MEDGPIELRDLRYFTLAAQMQHISRAAAAPGVSQPFLTKIIRQLENELGAPLFDHTGRGVTLSPCGKLVYEKSQTILALVDALHDDVDDLLVRTEKNYIFLVDAPGYLPEMTLAYQKASPGRALTARYCMRGEILEALRTGKADFATLMPSLQPGECPELESRTMYFDPGCIFLPPDSPLLKKDVLTLDDLRDLPIVISPKGGGIRGDLDLFFARHGLRPNIVSELADASSVVMIVSQGGACGVMNVGFMDHPVWGRYCRRHNTDLGGEVALCWNRRLTQQPSAQRFIAFAQTFFARLLQYQKTE